MNSKYEITNIPHEKYPFLHRIRALRDIGYDVKAGDLGGFVEGEYKSMLYSKLLAVLYIRVKEPLNKPHMLSKALSPGIF